MATLRRDWIWMGQRQSLADVEDCWLYHETVLICLVLPHWSWSLCLWNLTSTIRRYFLLPKTLACCSVLVFGALAVISLGDAGPPIWQSALPQFLAWVLRARQISLSSAALQRCGQLGSVVTFLWTQPSFSSFFPELISICWPSYPSSGPLPNWWLRFQLGHCWDTIPVKRRQQLALSLRILAGDISWSPWASWQCSCF